jgi:hypothetical protein
MGLIIFFPREDTLPDQGIALGQKAIDIRPDLLEGRLPRSRVLLEIDDIGNQFHKTVG